MLLSRRSVCFTVSKSGYDTPSGFGRKAIIADYYKNVKLSFSCNGHAVPVGLPETDPDFAPKRRIHCSLCIKMKTETVKQRQRFASLCCNHYYKTVTANFRNRRQSDSQYPDKTVLRRPEHTPPRTASFAASPDLIDRTIKGLTGASLYDILTIYADYDCYRRKADRKHGGFCQTDRIGRLHQCYLLH